MLKLIIDFYQLKPFTTMDMKNYMEKQKKNILQRKYYFIYIDNTTKFNNKLQIFIVVCYREKNRITFEFVAAQTGL